MKYPNLLAVVCTIFFTGCAYQQIPYKRPMQQAYLDKISTPIKVSIPDEKKGIATSYFAQDTSAAGAQYGLIGALTTTVIDGIANASPAAMAQDGANLINTKIQQRTLDQQLIDALRSHQAASTKIHLDLNNIDKVKQTSINESTVEGLLIDTHYVFDSSAEMLKVEADATLNIAGLSYKTPYIFEKKIPKSELTGPIYSNSFVYYSTTIDPLIKKPEDVSKMVSSIEEKYRDTKGALPKKGTNAEIKMRKELKAAKADYSKKEKFDFALQQWLANDAKLLRTEIHAANNFIASQLLIDLQLLETPSINGVDRVITTDQDGRTVTRLGTGVLAGQVESKPREGVTDAQRASFGWGVISVYARDEAAEKAKLKEAREKRKAKRKKKDYM